MARTSPLDTLERAISDEYGVHFETGVPVTFRFVKNTERSPNFGAKYGQDIEPAGRYLLHNPDPGQLARGWIAGELTFHNPLVLPLTGDRENIYGPQGWKARLHAATKRKGAALTKYLQAAGYDAIVTVDPDGYTREIVDMTGTTKAPKGRGLGLLGDSTKPLNEAYAIYIGFFASIRPSSVVVGPLADFADVLRANGKDTDYSDEQWVAFLLPFTDGDADVARDLWDGMLCQPSQLR